VAVEKHGFLRWSVADSLRRFPGRGRFVPEPVEVGTSKYREISIAPYRLFYRIEAARVIVLALLDARRYRKQVLSERLLR